MCDYFGNKMIKDSGLALYHIICTYTVLIYAHTVNMTYKTQSRWSIRTVYTDLCSAPHDVTNTINHH